jgi:hypothetical protein
MGQFRTPRTQEGEKLSDLIALIGGWIKSLSSEEDMFSGRIQSKALPRPSKKPFKRENFRLAEEIVGERSAGGREGNGSFAGGQGEAESCKFC